MREGKNSLQILFVGWGFFVFWKDWFYVSSMQAWLVQLLYLIYSNYPLTIHLSRIPTINTFFGFRVLKTCLYYNVYFLIPFLSLSVLHCLFQSSSELVAKDLQKKEFSLRVPSFLHFLINLPSRHLGNWINYKKSD